MPHTVISTCPVCSGELSVTRLQCRSCGTAIEGEFSVGRFGRLNREQLQLLESFLRAKGNLKELERELKVSYPTVRARVDALVRSLGLGEGADDTDGPVDGETTFDEEFEKELADRPTVGSERRDVLERLARHQITADEAATLIRALGRD